MSGDIDLMGLLMLSGVSDVVYNENVLEGHRHRLKYDQSLLPNREVALALISSDSISSSLT
jgi:hypothetical protein